MTRIAHGTKVYPTDIKEVLPELFEKQKAKMPDWLLEDYQKKLEESANAGREVR